MNKILHAISNQSGSIINFRKDMRSCLPSGVSTIYLIVKKLEYKPEKSTLLLPDGVDWDNGVCLYGVVKGLGKIKTGDILQASSYRTVPVLGYPELQLLLPSDILVCHHIKKVLFKETIKKYLLHIFKK